MPHFLQLDQWHGHIGHDVLVAYGTIPPLGWLVFAEIPVEDADALAR
jgi:hypothetical protein